jgi:hypothetical protein
LRSARIEVDFHPKIARNARAKNPSPFPRATSLGRGIGTGRLRTSLTGGTVSLGPCGSESGMELKMSDPVIQGVLMSG